MTSNRPNRLSLKCAVLVASALLCSPTLGPQMPPAPARLAISSKPDGAVVTINGSPMSQTTNATFVVSPGTYTISVTGGPGNLNCPGIQKSVQSGQTVSVYCTANGWQ